MNKKAIANDSGRSNDDEAASAAVNPNATPKKIARSADLQTTE
jgi:hypothetical protein